MKANCAPSSGVWKSAPSCIYLLPANLNSPSWHPGNLCYRAQVSKPSASERLIAPCFIRLGRCTSFHWSAGLWMWVLCAFSNQHISTFLRMPALFWTCAAHPSYNLGFLKIPTLGNKAQEAPPGTCWDNFTLSWSTQSERQQKRGADLHGMRGKEALGFSSNLNR